MAGASSLLNRRNRYQLLVTLVGNIISFSHGVGVGWLSPTLRKLQTEESPLSFQVDITEVSWVGSMLGVGSITGNILIILLLDRVGRKLCLYLIAIPHTCLWILIYSAQSVEYLYIGRLLGGISGGGFYIVLPIFIAEIVDTNIRGALSSMMMLSVNIGVLAGFIVSTNVSYHIIPLIVVLLPFTYFILIFFFPETPIFLIKRGRYEAAKQSFMFYKNIKQSPNVECESTEVARYTSAMREYENLEAALTKNQATKVDNVTFKDFVTKPALKAYCTGLVLLSVNQFSGMFAFTNYISDILAAAGNTLDPSISTIVIGVVQILGVYTTTLLCDIYGRKILMLISCAGAALSLYALGCFTYFAQYYDLTNYGWLPLVLIACNIYLGNIGLVGLFFVFLIEVYPAKIRSRATSCSVLICSLLVFTMLKIFPISMDVLGISITMWCCASSSLFGFVYFVFFLEETKGKSLVED